MEDTSLSAKIYLECQRDSPKTFYILVTYMTTVSAAIAEKSAESWKAGKMNGTPAKNSGKRETRREKRFCYALLVLLVDVLIDKVRTRIIQEKFIAVIRGTRVCNNF